MLGKPLFDLFRSYHIHDQFIDLHTWDPDRHASAFIDEGAFSFEDLRNYDRLVGLRLYIGLQGSVTDIDGSWQQRWWYIDED